jgi:hypothetical protein
LKFYHEPETFRQLLSKIAQATIPICARNLDGVLPPQLLIPVRRAEPEDYENFALPAVQQVIPHPGSSGYLLHQGSNH